MTAPTVVILAAGKGSRMRSALPKVLHPLCGRPLVHWPIHAARARAGRIVVVDAAARPLDGHLPEDVVLAVQERPNGTADALEAALPALPEDGAVVVLSGDVPLVTGAFVGDLLAAHPAAAGVAATMATMVLDDPGEYGRVLRDAAGGVTGVVEAKRAGDATPSSSSRSARSTRASSASTPARCGRRFRGSASTTRRASATSPTSCRSCAPPAVRSPRTSSRTTS